MPRRSGPSTGLLVVALLLLGALAVLGGLHLVRSDPAAVREELAERIRRMKINSGDDPEALDREMESILAEERYRGPGGEARRIVEKEHLVVHARALAEREASRQAAGFLARTRDVGSIPDGDLSSERDEGRALLARHPNTRAAALLESRLRDLDARLAAKSEGTRDPLALSLTRLEAEVRQDVRAKMFATARRKTLAFRRTHESDTDLLTRVRPILEMIEKAAGDWAQKVLSAARAAAAEGRKSEALESLEGLLPELSGFPQIGPLEALARQLR